MVLLCFIAAGLTLEMVDIVYIALSLSYVSKRFGSVTVLQLKVR